MINISDIRNAIKQIKSNSDLEWLRPNFIEDSLPLIGSKICEIFNESLISGIFPDWKCSTIIPVEKIMGTNKPEELRPINRYANTRKDIGNRGEKTT